MSSAMTQIGKHLGPADLQNTAMDGRATPSGSAVNSSYNTPTATPSASTSTQSSPHLRALSSPNIVIENGDGTDAWDVQGDLMDVNDDAGDWTSFETAPTRRPAPKKLPMGSLRGKVRGGGIGKAAARPRDAASAVKRQSFAVVADGESMDD